MDRERIDGITLRYNAPVTLTFALLSLLALALNELTDGWTTQNLFCFYKSALTDYLTYPRAVLHVLGNTSLTTCTGNIIVMLVVGPAAEERFGSAKVFVAVLLTAIAGALIMWFLFPQSTIMGASGVLFCMMLLASFNLDLLGIIGNNTGQSTLLVSIVLFALATYAFQAFYQQVSFTVRVMVMIALVSVLGAFIYTESDFTPLLTTLHLANYSSLALMVASLLFMIWVGYENINALLGG